MVHRDSQVLKFTFKEMPLTFKRIFTLVVVHALALTLFGATFAFAAGEGEQVEEPTEVRFVEVGWLDIEATTATTRLVLESLGYETTSDVVSVPVGYEALAAGDADVFLGNWMPSMESISEPFMEEGTVETVRANLEGAKYTLAVPQYVYDAGVTSVTDLADYEEEFGGEIYGIEAGNDGNQLIQSMIDDDAFGLGDWELVESSEAAMLSEVGARVPDEEWIVYLGWAPHPMNTTYDMEYLSDADDYFGPDYGAATVYTNVRAGYLEEAPNVGTFLENLEFTLEMEGELMGMIDDGMDGEDAAEEWLQENPSILEEWLDGVRAVDGSEGLTTVQGELGIQ